MALIAPNTSSTTPIVLANSETLLVGVGAQVATPTDTVRPVATGTSNEMFVLGSLFSDNGSGIAVAEGITQELTVAASGSVYSAGGSGVFLGGSSNVTVINAGLIATTSSRALTASGTVPDPNAVIHVTNTGTIAGRVGGMLADSGTEANMVINSGTISTVFGVALDMRTTAGASSLVNSGLILSPEASGLGLAITGNATVNNSGTIQSAGIALSANGSLNLLNEGAILSTSGLAVAAATGSATNFGQIAGNVIFSGAASLNNAGEIMGLVSISGGGTVFNSGEIRGSVSSLAGSNTIRNFDLIGGDVFFGAGDDVLRNPGEVGGNVFLNDGNDTYRGVRGVVLERVDGGAGTDTLIGGGDDDDLSGGDDADILRGKGSDDRLTGGAGKDMMTGGAGADGFVFTEAANSGKGNSADVITDFEAGVDVLDFSGFFPVLTFIGTAGFSKTAGELRLKTIATATVVQIDTDGNGKVDMEIRLLGAPALAAGDFLL